MTFDGIVTKAVTEELIDILEHGRITKIYQPYKYDLILNVRSRSKNHQLLISANPSYARIHITKETYENPKEPPMFCMLLRKHLEGSIIEKIEQDTFERVIKFYIRTKNEIGDVSLKLLIVEIMGKHSNIMLVDHEKNMIIDSIKHVSSAVNRHRTILPGFEYVAPPKQMKLNPLAITEETLLQKLNFNQGKIAQQMVEQIAGISNLFANEVVHRAGLCNRATIPKAFFSMIEPIKNKDYQPQLINADGKEYFYICNLSHINGKVQYFDTINELLDRYYFGKAERDRVKQQANDLERFIKNEWTKNKKKIKKLENALQEAKKADEFQLYGELLTANMYAASKGMKEIEVVNYYDENGATVKIPLDPLKTPSENAQAYFTKYQKLKKSVEFVKEQIESTKEEIAYFENLLQQFESASPKDIEEIREELTEQGYLKMKKNGKKVQQKSQKPTLDYYISSDGDEIIVGKNNKQNEYLTNRLARRDEIWLHTKDIPGSHVVIRNESPSEQTLLEAAKIAAFFSKAKNSSSVPVDYTRIRYVKKPSGAKPGFVIYENQSTIYVTPEEDLIYKLKKK
ncbi:Rqc2 family fibronectin-binding protein [Calidifontibacillus erzurumensis]|uniref:Rqc2 homolog RqcH n=1 Tax=Calidifontibacillus erzurumensis TaxID=2741433 RepID=A0A8J8GCY5_9BACI|nr:NFACT RNA binding domain-containing protein [Calidifontibacillus erzurumensis]NSL51239.1 fibronectin/fibrinogen-binding protein [Calidifontibacillus erzurumensis]